MKRIRGIHIKVERPWVYLVGAGVETWRAANICSTPYHLLFDSVPNLGSFISHWEINKFENC